MPWKKDGDKIVVDASGDPIWIKDDGGETIVGGGTISRVMAENKSFRERAEKAEGEASKFAGITDPAAAIAALEIVSKIDQKKLIDAGRVDEVRAEITKNYETKLAEKAALADKLQSKLHNTTLSHAFAASTFVKERVAVPAEMFQATFGSRVKVDENDRVVAMKADGSGPIYSEKKAGELADLDEAFEIMLKDYPHRDTILKAAPARGSGNGGGGANPGGGAIITRAQWEALPMHEQATKHAQLAKGELKLVD